MVIKDKNSHDIVSENVGMANWDELEIIERLSPFTHVSAVTLRRE